MFCCSCSKRDEEDTREICEEVQDEKNVSSLASSDVMPSPDVMPKLVESMENFKEKDNHLQEESKADVKSPEHIFEFVEEKKNTCEPMEERPICCKLWPDHSVPDTVGVSRALSPQDYKQINDFLSTADRSGWKPVSNMFGPKTTKKFMRQQEGSPLLMIKGVSPINSKAIDMFKFFSETDCWFDAMKIADAMFVGGKILEVHDAHHMACHAQFRAPPGITNRDVCFSGLHAMIDERTAVSIAVSVQRPDCPPAKNEWKWVRSEILTSGYVARESSDGKGCELIYIVQLDPKGWLPAWVVNIVAADQADNVTRIAKHFAKNNV